MGVLHPPVESAGVQRSFISSGSQLPLNGATRQASGQCTTAHGERQALYKDGENVMRASPSRKHPPHRIKVTHLLTLAVSPEASFIVSDADRSSGGNSP